MPQDPQRAEGKKMDLSNRRQKAGPGGSTSGGSGPGGAAGSGAASEGSAS